MLPGLLVTAPHASTAVPNWLRPRLLLDDEALLAAQDHGSLGLAEALEPDQAVIGDVSRLVVDLDQELPDDGRTDRRFPTEDLQGRAVWPEELPWVDRQRLVDEHYRPFYAKVHAARDSIQRQYGRLVHLDLNAWGWLDFPPGTRDDLERLPPLMLANGGYPDTGEGERISCQPSALHALAEALRTRTGLEVAINSRFKGGGVLRTFGHHSGNTVQLTWMRRLVCTPDERALDAPRAASFALALAEAVHTWRLSLA